MFYGRRWYANDLAQPHTMGYIKDLSWRGRKFMAYIAHRFRRQYTLTPDEQAWVNRWKDYEEPAEEGGKCQSSLRRLLEKEGER